MEPTRGISRRAVLSWIGKTAGAAAMYQAMTTLGFASESKFDKNNYQLTGGAPKGATVLILGAGLAGMTAAYELRKAGYQVKMLEYNQKAGGRCWTLRGGDKFTELGGATQECKFDNLLPSYFATDRNKLTRLNPAQIAHGIIQKPLFSREGANITALTADFSPTGLATSGEYGNVSSDQMIYQAMQPLPQFINYANQPVYPVIGSWVIGHGASGIGIREDDSLITKDSSHFVPHYFMP